MPYWAPHLLTDAHLVKAWQPGDEPVTAPALADLDIGVLLRLASLYDEDSPPSRMLVNLAKFDQHRSADGATHFNDLALQHVDAKYVTIAAQPVPVPAVSIDDVDAATRRAAWIDILGRTDTLAEACVKQIMAWDGDGDLPFSNPDRITVDNAPALEWVGRLKPTPRTAAFVLIDNPRYEQATLIDPATDAPVVRHEGGSGQVYTAAIPQRLPTLSPLAEVILAGPIWIRTADGTLYPAPRDAYYGLGWGYNGAGPGTLALLIHRLLDDITARGADDLSGAPAGLERLTATKHRVGTVLTRAQLEAARPASGSRS